MPEEKPKKKIDLKARLKTQMGVGTPGALPPPPDLGAPPPPDSSEGGGAPGAANGGVGATPVPVAVPSAPGSIRPPAVIAPPPAISGGIPLPPFARQQQAPKPEKKTAAQETIKVEIGEEIHQERKKWQQRVGFGVAAGALLGLAIGFVAGGSKEKGDVAKAAARGAKDLEKEVKTAGETMQKLAQKLADAQTQLESKKFPDELVTELGGLNVPFDATRLDKRNVGGLPNRVQSMLFKFSAGAEDVNKTKDSLRNILGLAKGPLTAGWEEEANPKAKYSILFRSEGKDKVVGDIVPNKEAFPWKGDFQGSYTIVKLEGGKPADKKATRWIKGDLVGNDPIVVPIDPKSMAGFTADATLGKLRKAIYDLKSDLEGNKENPAAETTGLIKLADDLQNDLHKIGLQQ